MATKCLFLFYFYLDKVNIVLVLSFPVILLLYQTFCTGQVSVNCIYQLTISVLPLLLIMEDIASLFWRNTVLLLMI